MLDIRQLCEEKKLNIFITLDSNYIYPLCVMLRSISATNVGSRIDLYVGYASLTQEDFAAMEEALAPLEHEIHPVHIDEKIFDGCPVLSRISKATYYRLLVGDLLPKNVDRVLYLDPDIVINKSLEELYSLDLGDNIIAGAIHLFGILGRLNRTRLGMGRENRYINAGVLLIDLKKWREFVTLDDIFAFIEKKNKTLFLADQDVVNAFMKGRILTIDERLYNLDEKTFRLRSSFLSGKKRIDLDWVRQNTAIIHYNGKHKPWREQNYAGRLGDFFEKYK